MTTEIGPAAQRAPASSEKSAALDGEVILPPARAFGPDRPEMSAAQTVASHARHVRFSTAMLVAALTAVVAGAGAVETMRWHKDWPGVDAVTGSSVDVVRLHQDVAALTSAMSNAGSRTEVAALTTAVNEIRADLDGLRAANASAVAQLSARLDTVKPATSAGPSLPEVAARLDTLEHDPRLAEVTARLDRIEHAIAAPMPTGSIANSARPGPTQSVAAQASGPTAARSGKPPILADWILRDVYSGIALVEGRSGSVREVVPGEVLPGAGQVQAIERHGRRWIVVTSRGVIDTETW